MFFSEVVKQEGIFFFLLFWSTLEVRLQYIEWPLVKVAEALSTWIASNGGLHNDFVKEAKALCARVKAEGRGLW